MIYFPVGLNIGIALNEIDEPVVSLLFQVPDEEDAIEMVLGMDDLVSCIGSAQEALMRASVLREMLTMFPDQKDQILANVLFRWKGSIDGS